MGYFIMKLVPMIPLRGFDGHRAAYKSNSLLSIIKLCRSSFENLITQHNELFNIFVNLVEKQVEMDCPSCSCEFTCSEWDSGRCPKCGNHYLFSEECTYDYLECWMNIDWSRLSED